VRIGPRKLVAPERPMLSTTHRSDGHWAPSEQRGNPLHRSRQVALAGTVAWRRHARRPVAPTATRGRLESPFATYNLALPLFWVLGLVNFVSAALIVHGVLTRRSTDKAVVGIALLWYAVGIAQATSVVLAWFDDGDGFGILLHRLGSTTVTGWLVLGSLILIGPVICRDEAGRLTRSFSIFGCYLLVLAILSLGVYAIFGGTRFDLPSPIGLFVIGDVGFGTWFDIVLYTSGQDAAAPFPRLVLFYPWPTILAYASATVFLICLGERRSSLRRLALAGAVLTLVSSASRAAFLAFALALPIYAWLSIRDTTVQCLIAAAAILPVILLASFGHTPDVFFQEMSDALNHARAGSSLAREWVYQASLEAFWDRPLFGYGWPGDYVHPNVHIQIGSHSSIYGTLYTGGLVTLVPLAVAFVTTLIHLGVRALNGERRHHLAFLIFFCLVVMAYGEGVYAFILPCAPILGWMAGTMDGPLNERSFRDDPRL
jgi:O-antigen ligase